MITLLLVRRMRQAMIDGERAPNVSDLPISKKRQVGIQTVVGVFVARERGQSNESTEGKDS